MFQFPTDFTAKSLNERDSTLATLRKTIYDNIMSLWDNVGNVPIGTDINVSKLKMQFKRLFVFELQERGFVVEHYVNPDNSTSRKVIDNNTNYEEVS